MAAHQWDFTYYMTEKEIKALPEDKRPVKIVYPKHPDFSTATRVITTKEIVKDIHNKAAMEKKMQEI
jgi:hypothetical protein